MKYTPFLNFKIMENNKDLKYQYYLYTWGGFYNDEHQKIHKEKRGGKFFTTAQERESYINKLRTIEKKLDARHLALTISEGFCCNIETVLHRVIEWEGKQYYSNLNMGVNYEFDVAKYHLEHKWYPGFNDYPLGEDFEHYDDVKIIQEWITGADVVTLNNKKLNDN